MKEIKMTKQFAYNSSKPPKDAKYEPMISAPSVFDNYWDSKDQEGSTEADSPPCNCKECQTELMKQKGYSAYMENPNELAFVMYKPDAFERGLVGELMTLVENKGLKLVGAKTLTITEQQLKAHYSHHVGKAFWPEMVHFYTSGPTLACIYKGLYSNQSVRQLIGSKHPTESPAGSIRGMYAVSFPRNLIHGSDSPMDAQTEMGHFFTIPEIATINALASKT